MPMRSAITRNRTGIILPALLLLILVTLNCGVKKNHKLLSFFFDGVPKPGEEKTQEGPGDVQKTGKSPAKQDDWVKMKSRHPDYFKNVCNNCHDRSAKNFLKESKKRLCYSCHDEKKFDGKYIHGPVAVSDCLSCHLPHESRYVKLLKQEDAALCYMCHFKNLILKNPAHKSNTIKDINKCTSCHLPHAAGNPNLLKGTV